MAVKYIAKKFKLPNGAEVYTAAPKTVGKLSTKQIASYIAHASSLTEGDVKNVISNLLKEVSSALLMGESVYLEDFGTFSLQFEKDEATKAKEVAGQVSAEGLKGVKVRFRAAPEFKKAMSEVKFERWEEK